MILYSKQKEIWQGNVLYTFWRVVTPRTFDAALQGAAASLLSLMIAVVLCGLRFHPSVGARSSFDPANLAVIELSAGRLSALVAS